MEIRTQGLQGNTNPLNWQNVLGFETEGISGVLASQRKTCASGATQLWAMLVTQVRVVRLPGFHDQMKIWIFI